MKNAAVTLIVCAVLTALAAPSAFARRITEFEKEVRQGERYRRAQEKTSVEEEQQEAETRAVEKKRKQNRQKNLRAQERRPVYDIEVEGDDLDDDLEGLE